MVQKSGKKYRVQIMVNGEMRSHRFTRKDDAENKERELKREQELSRAGMAAPKEKILLFDYAQTFIKRRMKQKVEGTASQDELNLRLHWLPYFGSKPLMTITRLQVQERLQEILDEGKSNATHNRILQVLHKLFNEAIQDGKALYNPVSRIPRLSEKKKVRKTSYWETETELESYIRAAYADAPAYGLFGTLALYGGARVGEIIALKFKDVDWERKQIRISRTYERPVAGTLRGKIQERTKGQGEGGEYLLPLLQKVELAIKEAIQLTRHHSANDFVLQDEHGHFMSYWTLQKAHKRICAAAKVKYITIHDMRRTFATNAENAGFTRGEVQAMLGHGSITTTENYIRKNISSLVEKAEQIGFGSSKKIVNIRGSK